MVVLNIIFGLSTPGNMRLDKCGQNENVTCWIQVSLQFLLIRSLFPVELPAVYYQEFSLKSFLVVHRRPASQHSTHVQLCLGAPQSPTPRPLTGNISRILVSSFLFIFSSHNFHPKKISDVGIVSLNVKDVEREYDDT